MTMRGLLGIFSLICMICSGGAAAAEAPDSCSLEQLRTVFAGYTGVGTADLQCQLSQTVGKIRIDNRMGTETYDALQKFCRSQGLTETGQALADTLVERLYTQPLQACAGTPPAPAAVPAMPAPEVPAVQTPAAEQPDEPASAQGEDRSGTPVVYRLSQEDFAELAARGDVLQQLETLKDKPFLTERSLKSAVQTGLADLTKLADPFAADALAVAQQIDSVQLTKASFDRLLLTGVPEAALEPLQPLQDLPFADEAALKKAVLARLQPEAPQPAGEAAADAGAAQAASATPPAKDYTKYATTIAKQADQVRVYELTEQSLETLKARPEFQPIPAVMLARLDKLQGVETIDPTQFRQAVVGTLEIVYRHYLRMILEAAGDAARLSAQVLDTLKGNGLPDDILAILGPLQDKPYADPAALEADLQPLLQAPVSDFVERGYLRLLEQQARRVIPDALGELPIAWDGGSCGCSRKFSKTVYGFYPFWLADQVEAPAGDANAKAVQAVDFSTLTRIGYYGLYLDANGEIGDSRQWNNKGDLNFVEQASKYRTYLDLVVYTDAWDSWSDAQMNRAAEAVADKLNLPLKPAFGDRLKALLPFVDDSPKTMGDGVTLYFQDVANPAKANARNKIVSFIQKLHQQLSLLPKTLKLNIMYEPGLNTLDAQASFLEVLVEDPQLLGIQGSGEGLIDSILVLLNEPTTDTKKQLRAQIENTFKGNDRRTVLRKILPVISPVGQDKDPNGAYAQFTDDLIYFEDNFHGVGLWPLPLTTQVDVPEISRLISANFKPDEEQDSVQSMVVQNFPQLCDYACPNRWQFRILFDILAIILALLGAVFLSNCRLRERVRENPWPVLGLVVVLILVFSLSLVCDPFWSEKSNYVAFGLVGVLLAFIAWRFLLKLNRDKLP